MDSNIKSMINLELFEGQICCKKCTHSWIGFSLFSSRGHMVLKKDNRFVFVADDMWYGFPKGTYFNIETIFEERGWFTINRCPICHFGHVEGNSCTNITRDVKCYEITCDDFECLDGTWILSPKSIAEKCL